ncbi:hypothetical protein AK812_SmicGene46848 [Symbiodinium microadriaticum]|uniref:Uncharacterized protein n=1 Tax=Symbiodinium microadriaticum TaxID=2951 RepID=A0A1Q9BSX4_SYMMI|nr:hypothetical protein AK812_SmicGene46848 [Symbiodinium microadriaticum]
MAKRGNQNKISDAALREHCLAFVRLKHDQQQENLEGMLAGLCGKQLREVVQRELQRVADDTALCFRNTSEPRAQSSAHAPAVQSQPTKRAQREELCRIALDRAQAAYVSLVLQTPGADFGPAFLHSGEEAPSWTRSRSPLQCFCFYIFPCQEILYFMHQTALCTPGAWSSSAMLPDCLCWVRQHGTLQLCIKAGSWQLLARSLQCGVPKMSAPESLPEEGQKAKRANPRSHYRADGTRRRTKGEKKARQGQGAGAGYRSSGWTAEWWESGKDSWAQHPAEEEPAEQQTAFTAGGATAETTGRAELPALDRAPPLDSRNSLLVRIPDGQGIPELREKLDAIRENSGLLHVLLSSKPKDGRWTLLLEGSKANQDKAKEQIMQIMVQAQREPPTTAQSAGTEGADSPAPTQLQLVPPALPLSSPPGPRTAAEPALDDSPREPLSTSEPSVAVQQPPATDAGDTVVVQELQQQSHSDRTVQGRTAHIFFTGALPQIRSGDRQSR